MSANLPINWADKKNSPLLADFIAKHGPEFCMTAEEINQLKNAVNEMAAIQKTTFLGVAEPTDTPAGTGRGYWEVITPGTYTSFGGVVLGPDERGLIARDESGIFKLSKASLDLSSKVNKADLQNNSGGLNLTAGYGLFPTLVLTPNDSFTVEMILKMTDGNSAQVIFINGIGNLSIYIGSDRIYISKAGVLNIGFLYFNSAWLNKDVHFSIICTNSTYAVKVNGVAETFVLSESATFAKTKSSLYVGTNNGSIQFFKGTISLLRVYNYALTTLEQTNHYNNGLPSLFKSEKTNGLVFELLSENLNSKYWYDSSKNGLIGELLGNYVSTSNKPNALSEYIAPSKGVLFAGAGSVSFPADNHFSLTSGTIEFTCNITDLNPLQLIATSDTGAPQVYLFQGNIIFNIANVGTKLTINASTFLNKEKTIAITYNNYVYNVFLNGMEFPFTLGSEANNPFTQSFTYLSVGALASNTLGLIGTLYSFRILNKAITQIEAFASYNFGRPNDYISKKDSSLLLELNGNVANQTNWKDSSNNQKTGLLTGDAKSLVNSASGSISNTYVKKLDAIPSKIYVAVGREFNLFFSSIIPNYGDDVRISVSCAKGKCSERSFVYTPTIVETNAMVITVKDLNDVDLETKIVSLISVSKTAGLGTKQLLFIGDSTTDSYLTDYLGTGREKYEMLKEIKNLITNDGGFIPFFLGTNGDATVKHEARSGYSIDLFLTNNVTYPNPFWDGTRTNFKNYMSVNSNFGGTNTIDVVFIQLGINDLKGGADGSTAYNNLKNLVDTILNPTYGYPSVKIIISQTPYACGDRTGWADAFLAGMDYDTYIKNMLKYAELINFNFHENASYPNVFVSPNMLFVDREYGFPRALSSVSSRSTTQIYKYTDSVHPDLSGYLQAADAYYSRLRSIL